MSTIFLATLGQRPEAITIAFDCLSERFHYDGIGIIHSEPQHSGIAGALKTLKPILKNDYVLEHVRYHEIQFENGNPLIDIINQHSAEAYYRGVLAILRDYLVAGHHIHLLVAGGRKAMSIYATLAASLIFGKHDRVWTVLSSPSVIETREFHIPVGMAMDVQVVRLPILPSRFMPETLQEMDVETLLQAQDDPARALMNDLSTEEMRLIEMLREHPRATRQTLAERLGKSIKTIDHQFRSIYRRMDRYYAVQHTHKKQILLDILEQESMQ